MVTETPGGCHPHDTQTRIIMTLAPMAQAPSFQITQHPLRQVLLYSAITPTLPGARRVGMGIINEKVTALLHYQEYLPPPGGISALSSTVRFLSQSQSCWLDAIA